MRLVVISNPDSSFYLRCNLHKMCACLHGLVATAAEIVCHGNAEQLIAAEKRRKVMQAKLLLPNH